MNRINNSLAMAAITTAFPIGTPVAVKEVIAQTTKATTEAKMQSDEASIPAFTQGFFKGYMKTIQAAVAAAVPGLFENGQFAGQSLDTAAKIFEGVAFTAASQSKARNEVANAILAGEIEGGAHQASGFLTGMKLGNCTLNVDKLDLCPGINASKEYTINEAPIMAVILREADACFHPGSAIPPNTAVPGIRKVILRTPAGPVNGIEESRNLRNLRLNAGPLLLTFFAGMICLGQTAAPANAVSDFSISNGNPNGSWSYGYTDILGGDFKKYLVTDSTGVRGMIHWGTAPGWPRTQGSNPSIDKNTTGANISPIAGLIVPNNVLHMHPGPQGQYSVLRWTATVAGTYTITGYFEGLDSHPPTTDVHILLNSNDALFGSDISSFMRPDRFNISQALKVGDTIDFAVGFGSNGNYLFDSTGLIVKILLSKDSGN